MSLLCPLTEQHEVPRNSVYSVTSDCYHEHHAVTSATVCQHSQLFHAIESVQHSLRMRSLPAGAVATSDLATATYQPAILAQHEVCIVDPAMFQAAFLERRGRCRRED